VPCRRLEGNFSMDQRLLDIWPKGFQNPERKCYSIAQR
jgi:hypothetical protein